VLCSAGGYSGGRVQGAGSCSPDREGVTVHRISATCLGRSRAVGRLIDWASYYCLATAASLRLSRFDVCLALTTPPYIGLLGALLKCLRGTRLVLWLMDLWPDVAEATGVIRPRGPASFALRRAARWLYAQADEIVSIGETMTARLTRLGLAAPVRTVHNWVPDEAVRPAPDRPGGQFVVMYAGNMGAPHEFETVLEAAELLRDERSVVFRFVGNGKERTQLEEAVAAQGLKNVHFEAPVPLARLPELLAAGSVHLVTMRPGVEGCVVPSKTYGIMAAGRPGILVGPTQCEVATLFRQSGCGYVVRTGEGRRLATLLRALKAHPERARRMGLAGRAYYERNLGKERGVRALVEAVVGQSTGASQRAPGVAAGVHEHVEARQGRLAPSA